MTDLRIHIPHEPVAKGRPRATKAGRIYTPKRTRDFEELVAMAARAAQGRVLPRVLDEPVFVDIVAVFPRPSRSNPATGFDKRDPARQWRPCRPDGDNLRKAILDGLRPIWRDDCIVMGGSTHPVYAAAGESPCVDVRIYTAPPCGSVAGWS